MSKFVYTTAIKKIRAMTARKKVIQGGSSAGKTFGILPILIDKAIKNDLIDITVIACTIAHLKGGAMKDFLKIMKMTNRFIPEHWNISDRRYTFSNGSTIEFVNADGDKAIGPRRTILYMNEANLIDYSTYNQLAIRTSGDIYIDFNPVRRFWAMTEVLMEPDSELLILTYRDNEGLPKTVLDELLSKRDKAVNSEYWKNWCKVYLDGEVGKLEGVIFDNWRECDSIPAEAKLINFGLDFGYTNDPSVLSAVYKMNNDLYIDEIFYQKGLLNSDISRLIKQNGINTSIIADSSEPKSIAELNMYGHIIRGAKKGPDSVLNGIQTMQNYNIYITKRSANIKDEFSKYSWKKDKDGNSINIPEDINNHAIDSISYALRDHVAGFNQRLWTGK